MIGKTAAWLGDAANILCARAAADKKSGALRNGSNPITLSRLNGCGPGEIRARGRSRFI